MQRTKKYSFIHKFNQIPNVWWRYQAWLRDLAGEGGIAHQRQQRIKDNEFPKQERKHHPRPLGWQERNLVGKPSILWARWPLGAAGVWDPCLGRNCFIPHYPDPPKNDGLVFMLLYVRKTMRTGRGSMMKLSKCAKKTTISESGDYWR